MNGNWSEMNKEMQGLLGKETTYKEGIQKLMELRSDMFEQITMIFNTYPKESFSKMPFAKAKGYHSKTLSYSVWHVFRIEDIVAHELIAGDEQILFSENFAQRVNAPGITTGNELHGDELKKFSEMLNTDELYLYAKRVMESTNDILVSLSYADLKRKFGENDKEKLRRSKSVDSSEDACWLIDYWCGKDVRGLLKMPFSRHWIMHIEAMQRIKNKLCQEARKGVDPIAYCGFYCNHCFMGQWCGSCRTDYNTCSFATVSPDKKCGNAACCQSKGLDGCYECANLISCEKGFYAPSNDGANEAKVQAMFIGKYGKKEFIRVHNNLKETYDFAKSREIMGDTLEEGMQFLERHRM